MEIGSAAADGGDGCRAGSLVATSPATFPRFATGGISGSHLLERTLVLVIHKRRTYYGPHLTCREAASLLGACAVAIPTAVEVSCYRSVRACCLVDALLSAADQQVRASSRQAASLTTLFVPFLQGSLFFEC